MGIITGDVPQERFRCFDFGNNMRIRKVCNRTVRSPDSLLAEFLKRSQLRGRPVRCIAAENSNPDHVA